MRRDGQFVKVEVRLIVSANSCQIRSGTSAGSIGLTRLAREIASLRKTSRVFARPTRLYPLTNVSEKLTSGSTVGCEQIRVTALTNCADETPPGSSNARRIRSSIDTIPAR